MATGKEQATLKGHTDAVLSVAFSPDGKTLASGSARHRRSSCGTWRRARRQATLKGHTDMVYVRGVQPGRQDAGLGRVEDKTIKLWDVATGKEQATLKGHTDSVHLRGVQPGRQDAGLGERGQDDQAVGRASRQAGGQVSERPSQRQRLAEEWVNWSSRIACGSGGVR